jgi:hypothetical protein
MKKLHYKKIEEFKSVLTQIMNQLGGATDAFNEDVVNDSEGAFADRSERWQDSDAGTDEQGRIDAVTDIHSQCERIYDSFNEALALIEDFQNNLQEGQ